MEALGFMLSYFIREGDLPWMGKHTKGLPKGEKMKKIIELKESTRFDDLFDVYSSEFITYMQYCRGMPFEARPDYEFLR
jgi:casein kinase 1